MFGRTGRRKKSRLFYVTPTGWNLEYPRSGGNGNSDYLVRTVVEFPEMQE